MLLNWGKRRLRRELDALLARQGSDVVMTEREIAEIHKIKLMLSSGVEERLRSIQSLLRGRHDAGLPGAIRELGALAEDWLDSDKQAACGILLIDLCPGSS